MYRTYTKQTENKHDRKQIIVLNNDQCMGRIYFHGKKLGHPTIYQNQRIENY